MAKKQPDDETKVVGNTPNYYGFDDVGTVPKDYTPEGFKTQQEFLEDMRENYRLDLEADRENREEALEDKKFAAGDQWDPIVLKLREGLPCLTINTIPQFTAQVVGDWRQNRNAVKVIPSTDGTVDIASVRSDLVRAIETKARADRAYDNAFESAVTCGDGAFQVIVDYAGEDVFDQEITIKSVDDNLACVWDRTSIDPTGKDANRVCVDELYPKKEFKRLWPDNDPDELSDSERKYNMPDGWLDTDLVRVTAYWRMLVRPRLLVLFEDGSIHAMDGADPQALMDKHGKPVRSRIAPCKFAQMHLCTGYAILAGPFEYKLDRLPIIRMTGRVQNVGGRRVRMSMVRPMKDAARMRNFHRSVAAEQLGYAPKAQWLATESAVAGREQQFREAHKTRDPLLVANDEAVFGQNLMRVDPPQVQAALLQEAATNVQDMKDVTGIHDASLGIQSNETSGRAIMARQREGDIASLTYHDNGNAAILEGGSVINQLIGQIYDGTRIVRTIGEDESVKLIKINDPMDPNSPDLAVGNYDVAITTGASYTTRRVEAAQAMMDAVQVFPEMMTVAGDLVAKAQDWPGAQELAERLRKAIPPQFLAGETDSNGQPIQQGPQIPPEVQQMIQQGQQTIQQLSAENEQLKQKTDLENRKLQIDEYNAETNRIDVIAKAQAANKQAISDAKDDLSRM